MYWAPIKPSARLLCQWQISEGTSSSHLIKGSWKDAWSGEGGRRTLFASGCSNREAGDRMLKVAAHVQTSWGVSDIERPKQPQWLQRSNAFFFFQSKLFAKQPPSLVWSGKYRASKDWRIKLHGACLSFSVPLWKWCFDNLNSNTKRSLQQNWKEELRETIFNMSSTSHVRFIVCKLLVSSLRQLPWKEPIMCGKIYQGRGPTSGGALIHRQGKMYSSNPLKANTYF